MSDMWSDLETDLGAPGVDYTPSLPEPLTYEELCAKCNGSGKFWGPSRFGRECFACKGRGKFTRCSSPEARARKRQQAEARKERAATSWSEQHPEAMAWIIERKPRFGFAAEMAEAVRKYGQLTDRQLETVERLRAQDAARDAQRAAERAEREASAPTLDLGKVEACFRLALEKGYKRVALTLGRFRFKPAPLHSANAGAVYVVDAESDTYLGKVQGGKFQRRWECDAVTTAEVVAAAADPEAAAIAYGKRYGVCAVCRRELSDPKSVERGIGPVCAAKFGW